MFPAGLFIMLGEFGRQYLWTTSVFLALEALLLIMALRHFANIRSVLISALIIFVLSFAVELIGVRSSIPFGSYGYTGILYPLINGTPPAISFAWFTVTASSLLITKMFLGKSGSVVISFVSAILVFASDILLEPFASFANGFWMWNDGKVPLRNFASWFILGFIFSFIMDKIISWDKQKFANKDLFVIPVLVFALNILNFSIINIVNGYFLFTLTGLALLGAEMLLIINFRSSEA